MPTFVYIGVSLDHFIATTDGGVGWLEEVPNDQKSDFGFAEFMTNIDAIIMGRNTFEKVLSFGIPWPHNKKVYVLSRTLDDLPQDLIGKVEIVNQCDEISDLLTKLRSKGEESLYIDGGAVIHSFLEADLVDNLIISTIPVILGDGVPLFRTLDRASMLWFEHTRTWVYNDALVKSHFVRKR